MLNKTIQQLRVAYRDNRARLMFRLLPSIACDTSALTSVARINLVDLLHSPECTRDWSEVEPSIASLHISNNGGSNSGDSRAVYCLLRSLKPRSILEIGTCRGATLARMAMALQHLSAAEGFSPRLTTVDILDVNDRAFWGEANQFSPLENIRRLGCGHFVKFVIQDSQQFLASTQERFDLIFLDGSHEPADVYQEIPLALKALNPAGWVLLHDYYPQGRPLFDDAGPLQGPFLAVRRLQKEGAPIQVLPLGNLPWWTRSNCTATSLALLGKKP